MSKEQRILSATVPPSHQQTNANMPHFLQPQPSIQTMHMPDEDEITPVITRATTVTTRIDFAEHHRLREKDGDDPAEDVENRINLQDPNHPKVKALTRKLDKRIIPMVIQLYLFSFLDRVNIGNARLMGLETDLNLVGDEYQIAVSVFFITYCISEVPSNLMIRKIGPNVLIPIITVAWGIIATCTAACQNFAGLVACRLMLGLVEAGLGPGLILYLSMFYTRRQMGVRTALLFSASPLSGIFGGLASFGVQHLDGLAGLRGWRWMMIFEGAPTIFIGISAYFLLPAPPETTKFLTESERSLLLAIRRAEPGQTSSSAQEFSWKDVMAGVKDWQIWLLCIAGFANGVMAYGFSTFLPTIISSIGSWNANVVQALTVPVYVVGMITYLTVAWISDRFQQRGLIAAAFSLISLVGYGMLRADASSGVSFAGCFVVAFGLYTSNGLPLAWLSANKPRWAKRAYAVALVSVFANLGGCAVPYLFTTQDGPEYTAAYSVSMALLGAAAAVVIGLSMYYRWINKRRDMGWEDWRMGGKTEDEIEEMGDKSPRFFYQP